jgi:SAM-dependent methyltransferase|nr:hypothetical protein [Oxalobacteraceae bacterium]
MMLSLHVHLLNLIDSFDLEQAKDHADRPLQELILTLRQWESTAGAGNIKPLDRARQSVCGAYDDFGQRLANLKSYLKQQIDQLGAQYLASSTQWFQNESCHESSQYRLDRRLAVDPDSQEQLEGWLLRAADWRWPGLILGPGRDRWIDHLVALDPLYIADLRADLLTPAISGFDPQYQRRLRAYVINDTGTAPILADLPQSQMGWVLAWNYFNYRPLEMIDRYLGELWRLMRPGGRLLFTFNDCDYAHGVGLVEQGHFMCYTPGHMIVERAQSHGWEVEQRHRGLNDVQWLVLRYPGQINSLRGAQCLAKIVAKSK